MAPEPPGPAGGGPDTCPPAELTAVAAKVETRLRDLFDEQLLRWQAFDPRLAEVIEELALVVRNGGKRLRAAFCYWAWRGVGGTDRDETRVIDAGTAFELLQAFALVHDDIMDDSATRRGRPTVHVRQARRLTDEGWRGEPRRYGEGVAILVGDLSHAYADSLVAGAGGPARRIWDELRIELNLGQYLDLRSAAASHLDRSTSHLVSTFKSALYTIVRPLQLGASLDGHPGGELLAALEAYGRPLGRAFQLKDDLLGVLGNERQVGKPVGDDLREGKPTELLALALERADRAQRIVLGDVGRRDLGPDEVAAIVDVLVATGAVDEISQRISTLVVEATRAIDLLAFGPEPKAALAKLADYVAVRSS